MSCCALISSTLRHKELHLSRVVSGVTHTWWAAYTKKGTSDKLKAVKALLMPNIVEMPSLNEEDESVTASRAAMTGLQSSLAEIPTGADEDDEEPAAGPAPSYRQREGPQG